MLMSHSMEKVKEYFPQLGSSSSSCKTFIFIMVITFNLIIIDSNGEALPDDVAEAEGDNNENKN